MRGGRIPDSLKAVFLASNRGHEVHEPPADRSAYKVFWRAKTREHQEATIYLPNLQGMGNESTISPQRLFHRKLSERGYFPRKFRSTHTGYCNRPTEHQIASYGSKIVDTVKHNQPNELRLMMEAGLSPNACNEQGESLLHMICRRDRVDLFNVLLAFDVDLQQCDNFGRTVMHDACWASNPSSFEIARCLLQKDPNLLFMHDERGMHPLGYVSKTLWPIWNDFLETHFDELYPADNINKNRTPVLCTVPPNSRPVPKPKEKIELTLVNMVANGALSALDAILAIEADDETTIACSEIDDSESTTYYSTDDDDDTETEFDSDEEDCICDELGGRGQRDNSQRLRDIIEECE